MKAIRIPKQALEYISLRQKRFGALKEKMGIPAASGGLRNRQLSLIQHSP
jgi:hypothetical protein